MLQFSHYLEPRYYDTRKSFYKKAEVYNDFSTNSIILKSYGVIVAILHNENDTITVNGWYSQTTARHINEFLAQHNFPTLNKKQMDNENLFPMTQNGTPLVEEKEIATITPTTAQNNYNYLFGYNSNI